MDHVKAIKSYIQTMLAVPDQHILIISGPCGWGKTTAVDEALTLAGVDGVMLGAYSTPLNFFNFLSEHSDRVIVADDTAGLFSDQASMALLKAATWPQRGNKRIIKWGSTTSKAATTEFEFTGKCIVVTNQFPNSPDGEAIRSRGFAWRIDITPAQAKTLLMEAAKDTKWYKSTKIAMAVAQYLSERINDVTVSQISYRTMTRAYRLAEINPDSWEALVAPLIPSAKKDPQTLLKELSERKLKVKDQARIFEEKTGLKARSFYYYRREANISNNSGD
jgi:hypothetical protein